MVQQEDYGWERRALEEGDSMSKGPEMRNSLVRVSLQKKFKLACVESGHDKMRQETRHTKFGLGSLLLAT